MAAKNCSALLGGSRSPSRATAGIIRNAIVWHKPNAHARVGPRPDELRYELLFLL